MFSGFSTASLVYAGIWVVILGLGGAKLTRLDAWYYELKKPSWQPPDWAFGPVWTVIFLCSAYAGLLAWNAPDATESSRTQLVIAFSVNGVLNMWWSALFFMNKRPDHAEREVPFLWLSILAIAVVAWPVSHAAAFWMAPYLCWVTIATVLNHTVVGLNRPFGAR
jgi:translocator protein